LKPPENGWQIPEYLPGGHANSTPAKKIHSAGDKGLPGNFRQQLLFSNSHL